MLDYPFQLLGHWLARYLSQPLRARYTHPPTDLVELSQTLLPGDVLLVDGHNRISVAIKYLTQSNWSHTMLYVGEGLGISSEGEPLVLIEADVQEGVRGVPISALRGLMVRICRPAGLQKVDCDKLIAFAKARIGHRYDLKNVFDLARYLFPTPPVPSFCRRKMLSLGSGDPTTAICSTLIAQVFQNVGFPILPIITQEMRDDPSCRGCVNEILSIRHHSLFVPRDFDISPYFQIVKPTRGVDYRHLRWAEKTLQQDS